MMTAPAELRQMRQADVYINDARAAVLLRDDRDRVTFRYHTEFLDAHRDTEVRNRSVAWTLLSTPTSRQATADGGAVPPFFAGLLPEGARLDAAIASTKTSADDHLTLLLSVGADTIGNVRIAPAGTAPIGVEPAVDNPEVADFSRLAVSLGETIDVDPIALSGVQPKVSAQRLTTTVRRTSGSAILKFSPARYPRIAENEDFFLRMARGCGLRTPTHEVVHDVNGVSALLVARFDRTPDGRRIPQEDACQVAGAYPASKYRLKTETAIKELSRACADGGGSAAAATLELLQTVSFSWLIGNGDLHGKNLSIYAPEDFWLPTPSYDLLCTQPYAGWRDPMAMMLYGRNNRLTHTHIVESGERLGLRPRAVSRMLDSLTSAATPWIERCAEIGFDDRTTAHLENHLRERQASLLR